VIPLEDAGLSRGFDYLPNGITDELISSLTQLKSVRVFSRSTSAEMKNKSARQIRNEIGAAYVIQGNVHLGHHGSLRISVNMVDTATQEEVWSKEFEDKVDNTFAMEKKISSQLAVQFLKRSIASIAAETPAPAETKAPDAAAYQHYLKGGYLLYTRTYDGIISGRDQYEQAIAIDPNYVPALAAAAQAYLMVNFYGLADPRETNKKAERYVKRALELDPENSDALLWQAERNAYEIRNWTLAESYYHQAIASNPNSSRAYQWYGKFLSYQARFPEAKAAFEHAVTLDP
jgi:TolB-like protein